ncbi:CRISPR-associated endonuclease Cas2 [Haliovirga abyssi]|uniref:CRISPR-associated endoribonuclease Cas2 n=1 Tax=Haliovirga abyssi TaxID=2996794 RepID=A0AAU9DC80_9FUSO|nr:CRISPR-associated endonuclease Cas2 [Haliovirga abyssi]BDU50905.1 CRISPR-associated endoribonuclease Cas2 [Haliovirga abyssi]
MYIILVYDIIFTDTKEGSKALRRIFKTCKRYLHHIQNSVFEGEISNAKYIEMSYELAKYIRKDMDSVIVFKQDSGKWLRKDFLGIEDDKTTNFL